MDLSIIVDILSIIAVVSSLVFAGIELRHFRISRDRESALELLNTFQSRDFMAGIRVITQLPDNQTKQQIISMVGEGIDDLYFAIASFEGLGALVYREEISLELLEDFFSGIVVTCWLKLRQFAHDERQDLKRETWMEWAQWLAERIMEREKTRNPVPAYIEHKDWIPNK
ncbi:MAG: hypothetical protein P8Y72_10990 [Anaerolineales bacterium]|jgi:hypothetical protein